MYRVSKDGATISRVGAYAAHLHCPAAVPLPRVFQVVGVDCGGAAPTLRNLRALPQPSSAVWPQLLFDMRYQGEKRVRHLGCFCVCR